MLSMHGGQNVSVSQSLTKPLLACRKRLEAVRKQHAVLKQQLEGQFDHLDSLEAKVSKIVPMSSIASALLCAVFDDCWDCCNSRHSVTWQLSVPLFLTFFCRGFLAGEHATQGQACQCPHVVFSAGV